MKKHVAINTAYHVYAQHAQHTCYAVGFSLNGKEYVISVKHLHKSWLKWSTKKGKYYLRLRLSNYHKETLINTAGCVCLGNNEDIYNADSEYNHGDQLERIIYEAMTGEKWHKDYTPWYEGADIEYSEDVRVQVKYDNATICSMSRIAKFMSA